MGTPSPGSTGQADLAGLLSDPARVAAIPPEAVPALLGELERLKATLWAQLMVLVSQNGHTAESEEERWLTVPEVAKRLHFAPSYVYQLARRGELPALRTGKYVRVRLTDLREWEARLGKNPLPAESLVMLQSSHARRPAMKRR